VQTVPDKARPRDIHVQFGEAHSNYRGLLKLFSPISEGGILDGFLLTEGDDGQIAVFPPLVQGKIMITGLVL